MHCLWLTLFLTTNLEPVFSVSLYLMHLLFFGCFKNTFFVNCFQKFGCALAWFSLFLSYFGCIYLWGYMVVYLSHLENLPLLVFQVFSRIPFCPLFCGVVQFHLCFVAFRALRTLFSQFFPFCSIFNTLHYNISGSLIFLSVGSNLLLITFSAFFKFQIMYFSRFIVFLPPF